MKFNILVLYNDELAKNDYLSRINALNEDYVLRVRSSGEDCYESDCVLIRCKKSGNFDSLRGYKADMLAVEETIVKSMNAEDRSWILDGIINCQTIPISIQVFH